MKYCSRCHRAHSGVCGIPAGVTLGFGARQIDRGEGHPIQGKPSQTQHSTDMLEAMLTQTRMHLAKVLGMLKIIPPELPEYQELLDRESKLNSLVKQLIGQIAARR